MTTNHQFAILLPLLVGGGAVVCTIVVHALTMAATINLFRHERRLGHAGAGALIDLAILTLAISFAFVAHLIEIGLWAGLLVSCGEFQEFGNAYYHSAVNYDTGVRRSASDAVMANTGATGSSERRAHVRCFDCDDLCCCPTAGSDQV
jgi:hypothetical protein